MALRLREGIYEHLLTRGMMRSLDDIAPARAEVETIDDVELPRVLSRHLAREIEARLRAVGDSSKQLSLANRLLEALSDGADGEPRDAQSSVDLPEQLLAIYRTSPPSRPTTPLAQSTLLTRSAKDPSLGHELQREIASADEICVIAAFITMSGIRSLQPELEAMSRRGGKVRVLTTVFTGTTEVEALEALARLDGVEVRISFDVRRTRLHAKAWLFLRGRGGEDLHTAYVGSANLTQTALSAGHEWMIKASCADLPEVIRKFRGTFDGLWNDVEFEPFDADSEAHRKRFLDARSAERGTDGEGQPLTLFTLRPFGFQEEILDRLVVERELHGHTRNLVVSATGTGKTVIAAFDYARLAAGAGTKPRMLFVAHRREILQQARTTFRHVLGDGAFGELLVDGESPTRYEHVFASVQSASRALEGAVPGDHFRYVVIDECHHLPADSYQRLIRFLTPQILVGLTATPERSDGKSLLPDFGGRVAAELRLWHALEKQLLVPFEYYGLSDGVDLSHVKWSKVGYAVSELARLYTGNHARVDLVVKQLAARVSRLTSVRALAFCVSVEHAEFMARALTERGLTAVAVHGETPGEERAAARGQLERREIQVICTCDLYNEGVDLPFVDTLLLLRPTASATLFLQQIGRGLRLHPEKRTCLVLDFIGQHRAEFRFEGLYEALTGVPRAKLERAVSEGFPFLPSGCVLDLDPVAQKTILAGLKRQVRNIAERLAGEIRDLSAEGQGDTLSLASYLRASGRSVEEVYAAGGYTTLLARAGLVPEPDEETRGLSERLGRLLHVDEPARFDVWRAAVADGPMPVAYAKRLSMLDFQLNRFGELRDVATIRQYLRLPGIASELRSLTDVLGERVPSMTDVSPVPEWPLGIHRHYEGREIMVAVGVARIGRKASAPVKGIYKLEEEKRELLFVTLDKSAKSFSPSTQYRDYAISPSLFHWETQSIASASRASGKRYTESPGNGWTFHLFVRTDTQAAYAYLGEVRLKSWEGDRPLAITWELRVPMPAALFGQFGTLTVG